MISDEQFVEMIKALPLSDAEAGDKLGVSHPTINRWRRGKNLPHTNMRNCIKRFVDKMIIAHVVEAGHTVNVESVATQVGIGLAKCDTAPEPHCGNGEKT